MAEDGNQQTCITQKQDNKKNVMLSEAEASLPQ